MVRRTTNSHKEQHDKSINDDPHAIHTPKLYRLGRSADPSPRRDAAISRRKKCFWLSCAHYLDWSGALTHQIRWRVLLSDQRRGRWPLLAARQSERQDISYLAAGGRWRSRRRVGTHRRTSLLRPATLRHAPPHAADNGFPSDHALFTSFLGFTMLLYSRSTGIFLLIIAVLVSWARVAAHIHNPRDIVGSFVIAAIAVVVVRVVTKWGRARGKTSSWRSAN